MSEAGSPGMIRTTKKMIETAPQTTTHASAIRRRMYPLIADVALASGDFLQGSLVYQISWLEVKVTGEIHQRTSTGLAQFGTVRPEPWSVNAAIDRFIGGP
jgi:hypothetical protein